MSLELAYVVVEVADPAGVGAILGGVAGMIPGEPVAGATTWRDDGRAQRVIVTQGPADDATAIGFEVADAAKLAAVAHRLTSIGYAVDHGDAAACARRRVVGMIRTTAPWGVPVEVVHGLAGGLPFASPLTPGGFKTDGVGFGHCVFTVADAEAAHRFVTDGLGMRQTDWLDLSIAPGVTVSGRFYHCNPRHHTLALVCPPGPPSPKALHHVMVEANTIDDVGAAFDRAYAAGHPIPNGIGRHDNDKMISFYTLTPAGFQVEVGWGAREVGVEWNENRAYDSISEWGHQPVVRPADQPEG
jgi:biphenyl-2,3-diol 1,2-dioxygenase